MKNIRIYLLDDHQIVIDGIRLMLENVDGIEIVGTATSSVTASQELPKLIPDILISDVTMPEMTGIELSKLISKSLPSISILILTMIDSTAVLPELLESNIRGYILKNKGKEELISAIKTISDGGTYFSPEIMKQILAVAKNIDKPQTLTIREIEVIKLLASGLSSGEIADRLFISENTVETHRRNILRKTNTHSTIELINYSRSNHIIG